MPFVRKTVTPSFLRRPHGINIGYFILGDEFLKSKTPLVIVNGLGIRHDDWEPFASEHAKNKPVLFFDYRGFDMSKFDSETTKTEVTYDDLLRDFRALMKHLDLHAIDLVAWSMGGPLALSLMTDEELLQYVEIRHSIIISCGPDGPANASPNFFADVFKMFNAQSTYQGDRNSSEFREIIRGGVQYYFDPEFMKSSKADAFIDRFIDDRQFAVTGQLAQQCGSQRLSHLLPKLPQSNKILIIHGKLDLVIPYDDSNIYYSLPQTTRLGVGNKKGQVPDLTFGHAWMLYHTTDIWYLPTQELPADLFTKALQPIRVSYLSSKLGLARY